MPRIVPLQLLKCLKVLLDDNGGILSIGEVKRIAGLMNRYSKKLVSKCIYVQILKVTKTELLGEFMGVGGWSLVYNWLNDAIRAMNWPLVQEILELLLLCPVDVDRLKINSAPKLVKGLCRDGGNEGVRILAKRLVEQWLKVVTENTTNIAAQIENPTLQTQATLSAAVPPQPTIKASSVVVAAPVPLVQGPPATRQDPKVVSPATTYTTAPLAATTIIKTKPPMATTTVVVRQPQRQSNNSVEEDPLADVADTPPPPTTYAPTPAQKKASEAGLVFKLVYKDGQQVLAKVAKGVPPQKQVIVEKQREDNGKENIDETETNTDGETEAEADGNVNADIEAEEEVETQTEVAAAPEAEPATTSETEIYEQEVGEEEICSHGGETVIGGDEEDTRTSVDKPEKESESSGDDDTQAAPDGYKGDTAETASSHRKRSIDSESDKSVTKENKSSKESKNIGKIKERDHKVEGEKDKDRRSSSSSNHKSSSHKSKSSSSSKSKSSSSSTSLSSSSHRSSSDKQRSDKERSTGSSSGKEKDRKDGSSSSSSSNKHKSSSSSKLTSSSSSTSSKDKHRDKDKEKPTTAAPPVIKKEKDKEKEKEREREAQAAKDKETMAKLALPSMEKLGRIPKKPRDETANDATKPTSITIPSKKASMSIEIRRDTEKAKTVKTYKSQFRSHGLTEEAPPPPSRKGLKKPTSGTSAPGTVIPTSLPSSLKRASPPPAPNTVSDSPTAKKSKIDINNVTVANEKPGAIKLIPPKKIQTLVETNLFSDALSAATGPKKLTKRKRSTSTAPGQNKEGGVEPTTPTSPDAPKVAPLKFYQDTLDDSKSEDKSDKENEGKEQKQTGSSEDADGGDKGNSTEDDDDIPLKKVKEDIEQKVLREQKAADDANSGSNSKEACSVDITGNGDADEDATAATKDGSSQQDNAEIEEEEIRKPPGPGCGPNGPPGVLMLHRRKGPKKKLTWRPQEQLEQIRYFELDENERVNVTKAQSFMDMKNLERFSERDAINIARRGFTHEDNMRPQMEWRPLIEVDGVPPHPNGNQSKQRKVQADREQTTLRALYFSHSMIPDSPAEAELEPHFAHDIPVIPLEDITGNPDAVSDYTNMPWPEPKGSPKFTESNHSSSVTASAKLTSNPPLNVLAPNNVNPYPPPFMPPYGGTPANNILAAQMQMAPRPVPAVGGAMGPAAAAVAAAAAAAGAGQMGQPWQAGNFNGQLTMGGPPAVAPHNLLGPFGPPGVANAPWQMNGGGQFGPTPGLFNNGTNFGPMNLMAPRMMANMAAAAAAVGNTFERSSMTNSHHKSSSSNNNSSSSNSSSHSNRTNSSSGGGGGGWRTGSSFHDNSRGSSGGGGWRSGGGGGGHSRSGGSDSNNGVCKAYMRGHCRLGKSCKYIHPKSKRI